MRSITNLLTLLLLVCASLTMTANTTTTVTQVSETVTLSEDVDYIITSDTPFTSDGIVDITNTDHAVLILSALKPSAGIQQLSHVRINGQRASNNVNCQVRIHNRGCIIMPYGSDIKPLTVFSEKNFSGEAVNDFGLENSGGFMNTLTQAKLNNRIQSFKLKRGYMVTFSTLPRGRGYSRCFIADKSDLEVAELPEILSGRISSYRVFKWNDTSKAGLANDTRSDPCNKLNVTSCYSFGLGEDRGSNTECVPHHIYEDWPSASACGSVTYSPHMKTNNEPGNSADDHPQTVDEILNNWENLMATGMRLCSPSSHDGSLNHLRAFMDSIDARGWRCDIIDLHCYWVEGSFNNIKSSWVDRYHRPIWISEWVWGASWNNNGIFGIATGSNRDNPTQSQLNQNKTAVQSICTKLNSWDYIERYFYWNSEANCSKLYLSNGTLTPAGEYYASMNTGLGYNGRYEFIPTTPRQYNISDFKVTHEGTTAIVNWYDRNGEYNRLMEVQRKIRGGQWEVISVVEQRESAAKYTYEDENAPEGAIYRIHITDLEGVDRYTNDDISVGDVVYQEGKTWYAGGNLIANGDFDMGMENWKAGNGKDISQPYFQVVPQGGHDGGPYLQAYGSGGFDHTASLKMVIPIQPAQAYQFSVASRNAGNYLKFSLSDNGTNESVNVASATSGDDWRKETFVFNSGDYSQALLAFRWLDARGQIDKVELRPLFETRSEAVADGVAKTLAMAETVKQYNQSLPALNEELSAALSAISSSDDEALAHAEKAISEMLQAMKDKVSIDSLLLLAERVEGMGFPGKEQLDAAVEMARNCQTARGIIDAKRQLQQALDAFLPLSIAQTQPTQPSFMTANGWNVKAGTYKGGDQRLNTVKGKTCWNAWWSGISASQGTAQTMEVNQTINDLPEGLYALACKATTEHYCLSDQHGYLTAGNETVVTPALKADFFDLPTIGDIWQTLTSPVVYVEEGGSATIGFVGSKQGATDNAWHAFGNAGSTGDKREGWWCATDFTLLFHPLHKMETTANTWKTVCLPYAYPAPEHAKIYRIAGILSNQTKICIEEIDHAEAGQPCIMKTEADRLTFYEYGEAASSPVSYEEENNLRGFFWTTSRAPKGSYVLIDGAWYIVGDDRPSMESYSAIIYKLDGMDVLDSWDGLTMDIYHTPSAIKGVQIADRDEMPAVRYTIDGRRTNRPSGLYIEVKNHQTTKKINKTNK